MRSARRAGVLAAIVVGLVPTVFADETKAPAKPAKPAEVPEADDELLEFLGSVDTGDEDFLDYLSQTDISQVEKHPAKEGEKK